MPQGKAEWDLSATTFCLSIHRSCSSPSMIPLRTVPSRTSAPHHHHPSLSSNALAWLFELTRPPDRRSHLLQALRRRPAAFHHSTLFLTSSSYTAAGPTQSLHVVPPVDFLATTWRTDSATGRFVVLLFALLGLRSPRPSRDRCSRLDIARTDRRKRRRHCRCDGA